jgi:sialic acid synthase SpsE
MADSLNFPKGCLIIGALGVNHNGDGARARKMADVAADAGCDAISLPKRHPEQTWTRELLDRKVPHFPELGMTLREIWAHLDLGPQAFGEVRRRARGRRLKFIGRVYDIASLEFIDPLEPDALQVPAEASTDLLLLQAVAKRGRPVVASTAGLDAREVEDLVRTFKGCDLALLHGVAFFPTPPEESQLQMIQWLRRFGCTVGYEDREDGILTAPVAAALGAKMIQKRFTLDRRLPGFEQAFSAEPDELRRMVEAIRKVERAVGGESEKRLFPLEVDAFDYHRRSVVAAVDIPKGAVLTREMLATKAPLRGLTPRLMPHLIGKRALYSIRKDEPVTFGLVEMV